MKSDSSMFVSTLSRRSRFAGQVIGMISKDPEKLDSIIDHMIESIMKPSVKNGNPTEHHDALWEATALLISHTGYCRKLIHAVAWAPVETFTEDTMRTAVECWQWLVTAKPDLELQFLEEMLTAWEVGEGILKWKLNDSKA